MKKLISLFIFSIVSLNAAAQLTYDVNGQIISTTSENKLGASVQKAIAYKLNLTENDPVVLNIMQNAASAYGKYLNDRSGSNINGLNTATILSSIMYSPDMTQYLIQGTTGNSVEVKQPEFQYNDQTHYIQPYFYQDGRVESIVSYCPNMIAGMPVSLTKNGTSCYNDQGVNYGPATSMYGSQWLGSNGLTTYPQLTNMEVSDYWTTEGVAFPVLADFATNIWAMASSEQGYNGPAPMEITSNQMFSACARISDTYCLNANDLRATVSGSELPFGAYKTTVSATPSVTAISTTSSGSSGTSGSTNPQNLTGIAGTVFTTISENKLAVLIVGLGIIAMMMLKNGVKTLQRNLKTQETKLKQQGKNAWRVIGKQRKYSIKKAETEHKKNFVGPIIPKRFR